MFQEQFSDCWKDKFDVIVQLNLTYEFLNGQEEKYHRFKLVQSLDQCVFERMNTFVL